MMMMIFRVPILLSFITSSGVVAFAPQTRANNPSFASSSSVVLKQTEVETTAESIVGDDNDEEFLVEGIKPRKPKHDFALLFDCDGVILETEELHRLAYNAAFKEFGVTKVCGEVSEPVEWSVGYYDILQNSIGGGKPKMRHFFSQSIRFESNEHGDPTILEATIPARKKKNGRKRNKKSKPKAVTITGADIATKLELLIDSIQTRKTDLYKTTVEENAIPRPGLIRLMDEALADDSIAVGVCSASTKAAAQKVLECTLGPERVEKLDVCILGDDVSEKKPSPMIYNAARERLGIDLPTKCVVVEDSAVGLRAAKAAGMRCLITYTDSTTNEDFYGMGADAKVPDLDNNGNPVTLGSIFAPLKEVFALDNGAGEDQLPDLLVGLKDDPVIEEEDEEEYDDEDNLIVIKEEETAPTTDEEAAQPASDEPEAVEESKDETPPPAAPKTEAPGRILKPKLSQDEMGNFSM